jgi:hypothetical protein
MIRGVGPIYAKKLVHAFGEKVFDVIEAAPDRLREIGGIGPFRAASILAAWAEQKAVRVWVFAHDLDGVGANALTEAMDEGHCGLPIAELFPLAAKLLEVSASVSRAIDGHLRALGVHP